ncbi:MAG TPA: hypothetical protein VF708_21100 [Pyrinomonadaceae bacterium]|jgi:hypothetical protein
MRKATPNALLRIVLRSASIILLLSFGTHAQQIVDPDFKAPVERPAYPNKHPVVMIDEAHANYHTAGGHYKPFADLLTSDGYRVVAGTKKFQKGSLKGVRVLVISNAIAPDATNDTSGPAFTDAECETVRAWVHGGGSLLLIADHTPYGSAAENLARAFGVEMGKGYVFDFSNSVKEGPLGLVFSRENGLLGAHTLLQGRNASEEVKRIVSFTGQSVSVPAGATALMKLSPTAYESPSGKELQVAVGMDASGKFTQNRENIAAHARPVGGRAQGIAMKYGKGRLVVAGEAALFSAQIIRYKEGDEQREFKMGMNMPGNDDRQFTLNVLHWLSGLLK